MKRCPKCNSVCPDSDIYCDLDGTPLITEPDTRNLASWKVVSMGAVAGLAIGVVLFVIYFGLTREKPTDLPPVSSNAGVIQPPPPLVRSEPVVSPSPSPTPSPSPSPSPSLAPKPSPTVKLSSSPISTSVPPAVKAGVTIRLANGSSIEADEAWEGAEGIWYRRSGVITLLDRKQVTAIERPTPAPSPSPSIQSKTNPGA